jgi:3-phenylpropionate/trans-cinnamate dioxygenase ferredoxin reductase subunit
MSNTPVKSFTLVGLGQAGASFIKSAREKNKDIKITLIEKNKCSFEKSKLVISPDTKEYITLADFAQNYNVDFIQENLMRVNPGRKKIYLKEKEPLDYQTLIIATGLKSKNIAIKGEHREGFFYLADIDLSTLKDLIRISDEAIGYVTTVLGLRFACALKSLGKEVRILTDNWEFLNGYKEKVLEFLQKKSIAVHFGVTIEEVIGEAQVRATKINPLKVFSSQLVFIDSGFIPNLDFFQEPVQINQDFSTNYENIYVIGDAGSSTVQKDYFYLFNQQDALLQGQLLAEHLLTMKPVVFNRKIASQKDQLRLIEEILSESGQIAQINNL